MACRLLGLHDTLPCILIPLLLHQQQKRVHKFNGEIVQTTVGKQFAHVPINVTGFAKMYFFHTINLIHFLNFNASELFIMAYNCLKFSMNVATVSGYIFRLRSS